MALRRFFLISFGVQVGEEREEIYGRNETTPDDNNDNKKERKVIACALVR
jgi:hypothetical protein